MSRKIILIFGVMLLFASLSSAQIKQVSATEFMAANYKAIKLMNERSWRLILKTDTMEGAQIVKSVSKIHEKLSSDRERFVTTEKIGDKETRMELIRIGSTEYSRVGDNPWTSRQLGGYGNGTGSGSGSFQCSQYTEENTFFEQISARRFRQYLIQQTSEGLTFDDMNIWVDENGFFLKTERTKGLLEPRIEKTHSAANYEYDPKDLKIEAPIMSKN